MAEHATPASIPVTPHNEFEKEAAPCRFFFRKQNRILQRSDFLLVYNQGKPYRRNLLHVFVLPPAADAPPAAPTRLGITVTKKSGNSVKRNRARRLIRESFRHQLPYLKPGYSIVVNAMRAATMATAAAVDTQLVALLQQAGVFAHPAPGQPGAAVGTNP